MTQPAKHTPGPWIVEQCSAPVYGSDGSVIAEGIGIGTQSTHIGTVYGKNNAHNANLIAAAPAMYEALLSILKDIEKVEPRTLSGYANLCTMFRTVAKTALAQAEGTHV